MSGKPDTDGSRYIPGTKPDGTFTDYYGINWEPDIRLSRRKYEENRKSNNDANGSGNCYEA